MYNVPPARKYTRGVGETESRRPEKRLLFEAALQSVQHHYADPFRRRLHSARGDALNRIPDAHARLRQRYPPEQRVGRIRARKT